MKVYDLFKEKQFSEIVGSLIITKSEKFGYNLFFILKYPGSSLEQMVKFANPWGDVFYWSSIKDDEVIEFYVGGLAMFEIAHQELKKIKEASK